MERDRCLDSLLLRAGMCIRIASVVLAALLCVGHSSFTRAQDSGPRWRAGRYDAANPPENLLVSRDEGLDILGVALDTRHRLTTGRDCSHLVHALYERAGFPYPYSNSRELYAGIGQFQAVAQPETRSFGEDTSGLSSIPLGTLSLARYVPGVVWKDMIRPTGAGGVSPDSFATSRTRLASLACRRPQN